MGGRGFSLWYTGINVFVWQNHHANLIKLIFRNMIPKLSIFLGNSIEKDTLHVKLPPMSFT